MRRRQRLSHPVRRLVEAGGEIELALFTDLRQDRAIEEDERGLKRLVIQHGGILELEHRKAPPIGPHGRTPDQIDPARIVQHLARRLQIEL